MERPDWAPEDIDINKPSVARAYDYFLGGSHNFAVDREFAGQVMLAMPDVGEQATANRGFLNRAVRYLVDAGVRQFLDLGSGIPTRGNVHEVAQRSAAESRVVYVDVDPIAVAHSRQLLADNPNATSIREDIRNVDAILTDPRVGALIDFDRPVAVLMIAVLHAVPDRDDPAGIVARLRDAVAPGSYLAISHLAEESRPEEAAELVELTRRTPTPITQRTRSEIAGFFAGLDLVEPGLVWAPDWRPQPLEVGTGSGHSAMLAGVGRRS
jgi:SAM-dependent methyltransferase